MRSPTLRALVATTEKRYVASRGQGRTAMRLVLLLLAVMAATAVALPASARIQPDVVCWETDMEFPVACESDDED
jgi:hypothetical protein